MNEVADFDGTRLAAWMSREVAGWREAPLKATRLIGGSSAAVYRLTQGGGLPAVLRTAQTPPRPDSLRALAREARVLKALTGSAVPHPRFLGYCEDASVLGAPFLITEFVEGWSGASQPPPGFGTPAAEGVLALSLVDALAELHALDYRKLGLETFGRPENFLSRQVAQWTALFERHRSDPARPSRDLPQVGHIASWLQAHTPADEAAALIHCDASFSNVLFHSTSPPRVAALIDWEIATLGAPLLDLGRAAYPFPDARGFPGVSMMVTHEGVTRQALADRYSVQSGRVVRNLDFYMVLAMFKLAALIEPNYARDALGEDPTGFAGRVANFVFDLLDGAVAIVDAPDKHQRDKT